MTQPKDPEILREVAEYYSSRLAQFGQTPRGVDWNGEESQILRFQQLCKVINQSEPFSLCDLGCGYGAFLEYMIHHFVDFTYVGADVSKDMITAAKHRFAGEKRATFAVAASSTREVDFAVVSGIFNVRQTRTDAEWTDYILATLDKLNEDTRHGFAFNCLTSYSDAEKMRDYLFYADPLYLFEYCKKRYSRNVALLHDYDLYEFTIIVRKTPGER